LHISDASLSGEILGLPCDSWTGSISLEDKRFDNCVPVSLDYRGRVEVNLEQDGKLTWEKSDVTNKNQNEST
jgi:hypothetical protein